MKMLPAMFCNKSYTTEETVMTFSPRRFRLRMLYRFLRQFSLSVSVALLSLCSFAVAQQRNAYQQPQHAPQQIQQQNGQPIRAQNVSHSTPYASAIAQPQISAVSAPACNCSNNSPTCNVCPGPNPAVFMCPPQQPIGVTSGACQPCFQGVDCNQGACGSLRWCDAQPINFEPLWHGEYIGPVRLPAMLEYRVRVNDELLFTYILNRQKTNEHYRLMVGDEISINSISDSTLKKEKIQIQPDGAIYPSLIKDPMPAAGKTIPQLRQDLEEAYMKYLKTPAIDVEPTKSNTALEDLRIAIGNQINTGSSATVNVSPDGRIQLPLIGNIFVLGMSIDEIKREINLRYRERIAGIEVEPRLSKPAQHFVFVYGEVANPGRFEVVGPTSVTQALAMAGGLKIGANNRQVIIHRRAEDWRMISTMLDLRGEHLGKTPIASDEIWLRDGDLINVPPRWIKLMNNGVQQVFTDGLYRIIPFQGLSIQKNQN